MAIFPKNNNNNIVTTAPNSLHTHQITNTSGLWQTSFKTSGWGIVNTDTNIQQIYSRFNIVYNRHKGNYTGINWDKHNLNKARLGLVYFYESEHVRKDDRLFLHCFIDTITDQNTDLDGVDN